MDKKELQTGVKNVASYRPKEGGGGGGGDVGGGFVEDPEFLSGLTSLY